MGSVRVLLVLVLSFGMAQAWQRWTPAPHSLLELWDAASEGDSTAQQQLRSRAEQGDVDAQCYMGYMYRHGHSVPKDFAQSYMWFDLAAAQGDTEATMNRDDLEKQMTAAQIAEAKRFSREWKPTPAK